MESSKKKRLVFPYLVYIFSFVWHLHICQAQNASSPDCNYDNNRQLNARICCEGKKADGSHVYFACKPTVQDITTIRPALFNVTLDPPNATCGSSGSEEFYCTLGNKECKNCNATTNKLEYLSDAMSTGTNVKSYSQKLDTNWMSTVWSTTPSRWPLKVDITYNFYKEYILRGPIRLIFQNSRPQKMTMSKSMDNGKTWTVLQYFYQDCTERWNSGVARSIPKAKPETVICTPKYSNINNIPYTGGEVSFDVDKDRFALFAGPQYIDTGKLYTAYNTTKLDEFIQFTSLRFTLEFPATKAGTTHIEKNEKNPEKLKELNHYYYAISALHVTAECWCNLHSNLCEMVNGRTQCRCYHNTEGINCERCKPLYNNRPWLPGWYVPYPEAKANECQKCNCNNHADSCTFSSALGYGYCNNCKNNTTGPKCEQCVKGYYHNTSVPLTSESTCIGCNCEILGTYNNDTSCEPTASSGNPIGQCHCKVNVESRRCDICKNEYYGLLLKDNNPGTCKACGCNLLGTKSLSNVCEKQKGQCPCKDSTDGRTCNICKDNFYDYPTVASQGCKTCGCDGGGANTSVCDKKSGQCVCRPNTSGKICNIMNSGFYSDFLDILRLQPAPGGNCTTSSALLNESIPFTGRMFVNCNENDYVITRDITGKQRQANIAMQYRLGVRYNLKDSGLWKTATLQVNVKGSSFTDITPYQARTNTTIDRKCPRATGVLKTYAVTFSTGSGKVWLAGLDNKIAIDVRCMYSVTLKLGDSGNPNVKNITIDSVIVMPVLDQYSSYNNSDGATKTLMNQCIDLMSPLNTRKIALGNQVCQKLTFSVSTANNNGGLPCNCDVNGTLAGQASTCEPIGGQCKCKPGVYGRRCDQCEPGYYNFQPTGCTPCHCDRVGSVGLVCDNTTGQCPCKPNVAPSSEANSKNITNDLRCRACRQNYFGFASGNGCQFCNCSTQGAIVPQCAANGKCPCKATITGEKCDRCDNTFFKFAHTGCTPCNCSEAGSTSKNCHPLTGQCSCKTNVEDVKCNTCKEAYFNLDIVNPVGCQRCFCYAHSGKCTSASNFVAKTISEDSTASWSFAASLPTHTMAPSKFLGVKYRSYGQPLTIYVQAVGVSVYLNPDIKPIILQGNGGKQVYYNPGSFTVESSRYKRMEARLYHDNWYFSQGKPSKPMEFYGILANLEAIYIRRAYGAYQVSVRNITMISAENATTVTNTTKFVNFVENCTCNADRRVEGLSCDKCKAGKYRLNKTLEVYSGCAPCSCNQRTTSEPVPKCNPDTGVCLNCRNGTMGDHCEKCAPNVNGTNCDFCVDEFWGLGKDGCRACNCSIPGALNNNKVCDKNNGSCTCLPKVTGRRCNECIDNYFNLTLTGCQECDSCYKKVNKEVDDLRQMRDNITSYVTLIRAQDNNTILGPFSQRLESTQKSMQRLIIFLNQANLVKSQVNASIQTFNTTLQNQQNIVNTVVPGHLVAATKSINKTNENVAKANVAYGDMENVTKNTYTLQQGKLKSETEKIKNLAADIKKWHKEVTTSSNTAANDIYNKMSIVKEIQRYTQNAATRVQEVGTTAQQAKNQNDVNKAGIRDLDRFIKEVDGEANGTALNAAYAEGNASKALTEITTALGNLTGMTSITTDSAALSREAAELKQQAEALNTKANNETAKIQGTVVKAVRDAETKTAELMKEVNRLSVASDGYLNRTNIAYQTALAANKLQNDTFKNASNMLATMKDFDTKANAVAAAANKSLAFVNSLTSSSQNAIKKADELQKSLTLTRQNAQVAKDQAIKAVNVSDAEKKEISPVNTKAVELEKQTSPLLNDVDTKVQNVATTNVTKIHTAEQGCNNYQAPINTLDALATKSTSDAQEATTKTAATKAKVDKLMATLANLKKLDLNQIKNLQKQVADARTEFDKKQLKTVMATLKAASDVQQKWLDAKKARLAEMQIKLQRLKALAVKLVQ